jgi:hypothetical protein
MNYEIVNGRIVATEAPPDAFEVALANVQAAVNGLATFCDSEPWACFCRVGMVRDISGDVCPKCGNKRPRIRGALHAYLGLEAQSDVPWIHERAAES